MIFGDAAVAIVKHWHHRQDRQGWRQAAQHRNAAEVDRRTLAAVEDHQIDSALLQARGGITDGSGDADAKPGIA